jgi:hypothetical protein
MNKLPIIGYLLTVSAIAALGGKAIAKPTFATLDQEAPLANPSPFLRSHRAPSQRIYQNRGFIDSRQDSLSQINSVQQLSDVQQIDWQPTDWAFENLITIFPSPLV